MARVGSGVGPRERSVRPEGSLTPGPVRLECLEDTLPVPQDLITRLTVFALDAQILTVFRPLQVDLQGCAARKTAPQGSAAA